MITLWDSDQAVTELEASASYCATVARIEASGFLVGPSRTEVLTLHGALVPEGGLLDSF